MTRIQNLATQSQRSVTSLAFFTVDEWDEQSLIINSCDSLLFYIATLCAALVRFKKHTQKTWNVFEPTTASA